MLDNPVAHLNLGDLLLSLAESQADPARAKPLFERAVEEYNRVLKVQPALVEAVNNKAWVLHTYLGRSQQALDLTQGLLKRVNPATLPASSTTPSGPSRKRWAATATPRQSYQSGLRKSPDHPVLNYHSASCWPAIGTAPPGPGATSSKALANRDQLSPAMVQDAEHLVQQLGAPIRGN